MANAGLSLVEAPGAHGPGAARRKAWMGFVVLGLMVAGHAVLETARDTLFLSELPASQLPFLYLAVAGLTVVATRLPLRRCEPARSAARSPPRSRSPPR